jgi:hypothetical protein
MFYKIGQKGPFIKFRFTWHIYSVVVPATSRDDSLPTKIFPHILTSTFGRRKKILTVIFGCVCLFTTQFHQNQGVFYDWHLPYPYFLGQQVCF